MLPDGGTRGSAASGTSQADPAALTEYAATGAEMISALRAKQSAVQTALEILRGFAANEYVPGVGDVGERLATLVADWEHLDTFVGDVGEAFRSADGGAGAGVSGGGVLTVSDNRLARVGRIGFASRSEAVAAAQDLAADLQRAVEDGDTTTEEMERLIARAERGQHDAAFAVAFVREMGVDGLVTLPGLLEATQPVDIVGRGGTRPSDPSWPTDNLAPFAMILNTAMDTRADMHGSPRRDPDNAHLSDEDRLGTGWVNDFVRFDGEGEELLAYSEVVVAAALPADVLVRVGNNQLDGMLSGERTGHHELHAGTNILTAIGESSQASLDWLASERIAGRGSGTTNLQLLLEYEVRPAAVGRGFVPPPGLGDALATVVDAGLQHPTREESDPLFRTAVETVAAEGEVHYDELKPVLGEAARTHIDQLANSTTAPEEEGGTWPGEDDSVAFLEAIMDNDEATEAVYKGATEFIAASVADSLATNGPLDAEGIGGVAGLVTVADANVAEAASADRMAARQQFVHGVSLATNVIGAIPIGGDAAELIGALRSLGSTGVNEMARLGLDVPDPELAQDLAEIGDLRDELRQQMAQVTAHHNYARGLWTENDIVDAVQTGLEERGLYHDGMDTNFLRDAPDGRGRILKAYDPNLTQAEWDELSPQQQEAVMRPDDEAVAYRAWLYSDRMDGETRTDRTAASEALDRVVTDHSH